MALEREHDTSHEEEMDNLLKRRNAIQKRRDALQLQVDQFGRHAPVHVRTELAEANRELAELNAQILPETPAYLDRMSELERSKYNTALIMKLDMDMRDWRRGWRREFRWLIVAVAVLNLAGLAAQRLTVTWHVYAIVAILVAVLAYVAIDIWQEDRKKR